MIALSCAVKISAVRHLVLSQCMRVIDGHTDRQTDGQTDGQNYDSQDRPRICSRGKNFKVTLQNTESRKTGSRVRSLKQFSFQSPTKSLQRMRRCYGWRKTVPGARSGNRKGAVANGAAQCRSDDQCRCRS